MEKKSFDTKTVPGHRLNLQMISSFEFGKYDDTKKVSQEEFAFSVYARMLRDEKIDQVLSINSVPEIYKKLKNAALGKESNDCIKRIGSIFEDKQLKLMLVEASKNNMASKVYAELLDKTKTEEVRQDIKEYHTKSIRQTLFRGEKGDENGSNSLRGWLDTYNLKKVDFNEELDNDDILTLKVIKFLYCNRENIDRRSRAGTDNSFCYSGYGDYSDLQEIEALLIEVRKELSVDFIKKYDDYYNLIYAWQSDAEQYFSSLLSPYDVDCNFLKKDLNLYFEFLHLYAFYTKVATKYLGEFDSGSCVTDLTERTPAYKRNYDLSEQHKKNINKIKSEIKGLDKDNSWMRLKTLIDSEETSVEKFYKYLLRLRMNRIVDIREKAHKRVSRLIERFSTQDIDRVEFSAIYEKLSNDTRKVQIDIDFDSASDYLPEDVRTVLIDYKKFINYDFLVADNEKAKRLSKYVYVLCGSNSGRIIELEVRTLVVMLRFIYLMASETEASDDCGKVFLNRIMRSYNKYEIKGKEDKKKTYANIIDGEFIRLLNLIMFRAAAPGKEFKEKHFLSLYNNATQMAKCFYEHNYRNLYVLIFLSVVGMKLKQEYLKLVAQK